MQHRVFESQQRQLEPHPQQAFPGQHRLDPLQGKDRLPLAVGYRHPVEHQVGIQSLPARLDPADPDLQADGTTGRGFDLALVGADPGQDRVAQGEHQRDEQQPAAEQGPRQLPPATVDRRAGQKCLPVATDPGQAARLPGVGRFALLIHAHYSCVRLLCQKGS